MKEKYIKSMDKIELSTKKKQDILNKVINEDKKPKMNFNFQKLLKPLSYATAFVILFLVGFNLIPSNNEKLLKETINSPFILTVYAGEVDAFNLIPNVSFEIKEYSPLMSSVPGLPLKITKENSGLLTVNISNGILLSWNQDTGIVTEIGKQATIESGETIYWSPIIDGKFVIDDSIKISDEIGNVENIKITSNESNYTGMLLE